MRQFDPIYYYKFSSKSDPHFCTACKVRDNSDAQLLNNINYSAWVNYGMCQKCMQYFLGFDNGLLMTEQRKLKLIQILKKDNYLIQGINQHFRFYLFPQDLQRLKYHGYRQVTIFDKNHNIQKTQIICMSCQNKTLTDKSTFQKPNRCSKCNNQFKYNFIWEGLEE